MQNPGQNQHEEMVVPSTSRHKRTTFDSDDGEEDIMNKIQEVDIKQNQSRKKKIETVDTTPEKDKDNAMEIQGKIVNKLRYNELPQDIVFFLTEIYPYGSKLFITGLMQNGQTLNLVATEPMRQLYFALRNQYSGVSQLSTGFLSKAQAEIKHCLHNAGISKFTIELQEKSYVFELQGMPREKRPYFKVRFPFGKEGKDELHPDWQGQTFKYVFGTTYTPLQLTILNIGIKGPCWLKIQKKYLNESKKWIESGLCAQLSDPQLLQIVNELTKPPSVRVMSISIKAVVPAQVKVKKFFNTNRVDELHIYAISYYLCEEYQMESKPHQYRGNSRTLYLKEFGPQKKDKDYISCEDQKQLFAKFQADILSYDPDVLVCHDSAKVLDTLIQRMARVGDKHLKPKLGRLSVNYQLSKSNQNQRIGSTVAGRLVCDTFLHSKDMIKSVDYELQSMAVHIKPEQRFQGMTEEQTINYLNENKAFHVIKKAREEAEVTFALMNHLQILQMTSKLSNICGNTWKRSLQIQRAERNEFLIMHECIKKGLIIPDKFRKQKQEDEEEIDRKKYQGGHVIQPEKGFYKDYILLLDFNSLYPSIIREYNVCFSVIKRPLVPLSNYYRPKKTEKEKLKEKEKKENKDMFQNIEHEEDHEDMEVRPPPRDECAREKWGFLPQLIDKIVERRKKCKKAMKNAPAEKALILDIQQKCYKLVANSIYGCLGFSISRFYSKHLAALITRMGRQALLRAKDIVSSTGGVKVIYGDTDSLMIMPTASEQETQIGKLMELKKISDELKTKINQQYNNLQIDIDGIFKPLILLMKKKYVARKLNNFQKVLAGQDKSLNFGIEYKGIEVVRRDGFKLARDFLRKALEILMNSQKGEAQETYEEIYQYARKLKEEFSTLSYKQFLFSRQLNKAPTEYARGDTIPHVKVALDRVKAGQRVQTLVNHTIYYIVCKPQDKSQDTLAKCCFDDRAYERSQKFYDEKGPLQIDQEYYKAELLQPLGRITQHLQDFSTDRLLEEIGLSDQKRKKFKKQMEAEREEGQAILQGCISHSGVEKGKKFAQFMGQIECICGHKFGVAEEGKLTIFCPACKRQALAAISNRLQLILKQKINEYYTNTFKCRCGKQYSLNLLGDCCKIKVKPRSNIPFEIHELIYVGKDMCLTAAKQAKDNVAKRLKSLQDMLDGFLEQSDYERVQGLINILKV